MREENVKIHRRADSRLDILGIGPRDNQILNYVGGRLKITVPAYIARALSKALEEFGVGISAKDGMIRVVEGGVSKWAFPKTHKHEELPNAHSWIPPNWQSIKVVLDDGSEIEHRKPQAPEPPFTITGSGDTLNVGPSLEDLVGKEAYNRQPSALTHPYMVDCGDNPEDWEKHQKEIEKLRASKEEAQA